MFLINKSRTQKQQPTSPLDLAGAVVAAPAAFYKTLILYSLNFTFYILHSQVYSRIHFRFYIFCLFLKTRFHSTFLESEKNIFYFNEIPATEF